MSAICGLSGVPGLRIPATVRGALVLLYVSECACKSCTESGPELIELQYSAQAPAGGQRFVRRSCLMNDERRVRNDHVSRILPAGLRPTEVSKDEFLALGQAPEKRRLRGNLACMRDMPCQGASDNFKNQRSRMPSGKRRRDPDLAEVRTETILQGA